MEKKNKSDIVEHIKNAHPNASPQVVAEMVDAFLDATKSQLLKGNTVEFRDFGVFEVKDRPERDARNPKTGATIRVPAHKVMKFRPGKKLKDAIRTS